MHDVRAQIRLAQMCRTTHGLHIRIHFSGHVFHQSLYALNALEQGAQLAMEDHPAQVLHTRIERPQAVALKIKGGILKPGTHHPLAAYPDISIHVRKIGDGKEMPGQYAIRPTSREILLLILQHRTDDFLRQIQEFFIEASRNHYWKFRAGTHFLKQGL